MSRRRLLAVLAVTALAAACGKKGALKRKEDERKESARRTAVPARG